MESEITVDKSEENNINSNEDRCIPVDLGDSSVSRVMQLDCLLTDNVFIKKEFVEIKHENKLIGYESEEYLSGEDLNSESIFDENKENNCSSLNNESYELAKDLASLKLSQDDLEKDFIGELDNDVLDQRSISSHARSSNFDQYSSDNENDELILDEHVDNNLDIIGTISKSQESINSNKSKETKSKTLDNIVDKKDPAYIPRKGWFFQHDTRDDGEFSGEDSVPIVGEKDVVTSDIQNHKNEKRNLKEENLKTKMDGRWTHDLFDEYEQSPKTPEEILLQYGHDIRDEDTTGNGKRSRKFRRNIPKYDRSWQDPEAYQRRKFQSHEPSRYIGKNLPLKASNPKMASETVGIKPNQSHKLDPSHSKTTKTAYHENRHGFRDSRDTEKANYKTDARSSNNYKADKYPNRDTQEPSVSKRYSRTRPPFQSQYHDEERASSNRSSQNNVDRPLNRRYNNAHFGRDKENLGRNNYENSRREQQPYHNQQQGAMGGNLRSAARPHRAPFLNEISPNVLSNGDQRVRTQSYRSKHDSPHHKANDSHPNNPQNLHGNTKAYTKSRKPLPHNESGSNDANQPKSYVKKHSGADAGSRNNNDFISPHKRESFNATGQGSANEAAAHYRFNNDKSPTKQQQQQANSFPNTTTMMGNMANSNQLNYNVNNPLFIPPMQQMLMQRAANLNNFQPLQPTNMSHNSFAYMNLAANNGGHFAPLHLSPLSQSLMFANPYFSPTLSNLPTANGQKMGLNHSKTYGKANTCLFGDSTRPASTAFYSDNGSAVATQFQYIENGGNLLQEANDVMGASFPYSPFYSPPLSSFLHPQQHNQLLQNLNFQDPSLLHNTMNSYPAFYNVQSPPPSLTHHEDSANFIVDEDGHSPYQNFAGKLPVYSDGVARDRGSSFTSNTSGQNYNSTSQQSEMTFYNLNVPKGLLVNEKIMVKK